jgi:hypothetical protein
VKGGRGKQNGWIDHLKQMNRPRLFQCQIYAGDRTVSRATPPGWGMPDPNNPVIQAADGANTLGLVRAIEGGMGNNPETFADRNSKKWNL